MSHLTEQDRCRIENLLNADLSPLAIIRQENRAHSTIVRELRKHRKENESDRRQKKNYCTRKNSCFRKDVCQYPRGNCPRRCNLCKIIECPRSSARLPRSSHACPAVRQLPSGRSPSSPSRIPCLPARIATRSQCADSCGRPHLFLFYNRHEKNALFPCGSTCIFHFKAI